MNTFIQNSNIIFKDFAFKYDYDNTNILRKIIHSFSVAEKCFVIACKMGLDSRKRDLVYLAGVLHDTGRFVQWQKYQSFEDANTCDHGDLSYDIINKMEIPFISEREKEVVATAVKFHTKPYMGQDEEVKLFCKILNNADSFCNIIAAMNGSQQVSQTENGYTEELLQSFKNKELLVKYVAKTKLDRIIKIFAMTYYVNFDFLRREIIENKYFDILFERYSRFLEDDEKLFLEKVVKGLIETYV